MINFKYEEFKREVKDLIELRNEMYANRKSFRKLNDKIALWFYIKTIDILVPICNWIIKREERDLQ